MTTNKQREWANWILDRIGAINPYNRQAENSKDQYAIYQAGFLAAYLASLLVREPQLRREFERHCEQLGPAARPPPKN